MALPRIDTIQGQDYPVWVQLNSSSEIFVRHIPLPFAGWLERAYFIANVLQGGQNTLITLGLDGGAALETLTWPTGQAARTPINFEFSQPGSPIQFAEGQALNIATDGGGTGANTFTALLVLRRL